MFGEVRVPQNFFRETLIFVHGKSPIHFARVEDEFLSPIFLSQNRALFIQSLAFFFWEPSMELVESRLRHFDRWDFPESMNHYENQISNSNDFLRTIL